MFARSTPQVYYVAPTGRDTNDGSLDAPWATLNHAANTLKAGDTVYLRSGYYTLATQIKAKNSGSENTWILYSGYPGESVTIDANNVVVPPPTGQPPFPHDQGAFQLENVHHIRVQNLKIVNSHNSGLTVRNSHHIELLNNQIENTFAPGIGVWGSDRAPLNNPTHHIQVIGNTVVNANDAKLGYEGFQGESPHEAISLETVEFFEVANNLVRNSQKEGIDIKGASKHGRMHHNYVHHVRHQGLYVDSWWGVLDDIEVDHNVVHDCRGAGFVVSVEGGTIAKNIRVHHNLIFDNWGTGILFGRWGSDGPRENIQITNNTVHHNGHGKPNEGEQFYWITGGLYFFSSNLRNIQVSDNIFSENQAFQIGYSDRYLKQSSDINQVFQQKQIDVSKNLIFDTNNLRYPIYAGWAPDNLANISPINGNQFVDQNPRFIDPKVHNFYLQKDSPALIRTPQGIKTLGAFPIEKPEDFWWKSDFPPNRSVSLSIDNNQKR